MPFPTRQYQDENYNMDLYETKGKEMTITSFDIIKKRLLRYTDEEVSLEERYELIGRLIALKTKIIEGN